MASEKYLVFPHALSSGLMNMLMEIELRVVLACLSNRTLVSVNKYPCFPQPDDHLYGRYRAAAMLDLFDFPVKHISMTKMYKRGFKSLYSLPWQGECASEAVFRLSSDWPDDKKIVDDFYDGRKFTWQFPENDDDVWALLGPRRTFCNSTYFFLAHTKQKNKIKNIISLIQPKLPYLNLAKKIVKDLGRFNSIHVRLGDFKHWWVKTPTGVEIANNIASVMKNDMPLVICTDNSHDRAYFAPITQCYSDSIFVDEYIQNEYKEELNQLPFNDASVIALISSLVASYGEVFTGSIYSTFTSAIHRRRLMRDPDLPILFSSNPFDDRVKMENCEFKSTDSGSFSWNRLAFPNPETSRANAWLREWPETVS